MYTYNMLRITKNNMFQNFKVLNLKFKIDNSEIKNILKI